jgi:hypothetical protein
MAAAAAVALARAKRTPCLADRLGGRGVGVPFFAP